MAKISLLLLKKGDKIVRIREKAGGGNHTQHLKKGHAPLDRKTVQRCIIRSIPLLFMATFLIIGVFYVKDVSAEDLVHYTPDNLLLAAVFFWLFYALKSLAMVFPIIAIYIGAGLIFPPWIAIGVNAAGVVIGNTIPYCIGKFSCGDWLDGQLARHEKIRRVYNWTNAHDIVSAYILRVIGCMPGDVVSLFLGASKMRFWSYTVGSLLGKLPVMALATFLGRSIDGHVSLPFLLLLAGLVAVSFGSTLILSWWERRKARQASLLTCEK